MTNNKKEKIPDLRFHFFNAPWKQERIGKYLIEYKERVSANTEIPVLTSSRTGLYLQKNYFDNREVNNEGEYGVVPRGYFTYRHMSDDSTFKFNINTLCDKGAVSKEYPVFTTKELDSYFLQLSLNYGGDFKRFAIIQKMGGTRTRLYFKKLVNLKLHLPSLPEQQKIADFLTTIDTRLRQLREKAEHLRTYKKGVMQQLFSQQIRFKAEDGGDFVDWEEKRLGEVTTFFKGKGISKADIVENGKTPCIRYGELYTDYGQVITKIKSSTDIPSNDLFLSKKNDVIIPASGETSIDIATAACVTLEKIALSGDLNILRTKENGVFLAYYLSFGKKNSLARLSQGSSVIHLYSSQLKNLKAEFPSLPEQQKIADFLTALDERIQAVETQIEQTEAFKRGLLQQMFV